MNKKEPAVSVIIPCFNHGLYLSQALESVQAQTYPNIEVIIVDDGSTEQRTAATIKQLALNPPPNTIVLLTDNFGPACARNTGIKRARGQYILPLDADDFIEKTYIEKAIRTIESQENIGIVSCEGRFFGTIDQEWKLPPYKFPDILLDNTIHNCSLYRRVDWEEVGGYNYNMNLGWEDYDFWLSIIELGRKVIRIPEVLFFYRKTNESRTNKMTSLSYSSSYIQLVQNHRKLYEHNVHFIISNLVATRDNEHLVCLENRALHRENANLRKHIQQIESGKVWKLRAHVLQLKQWVLQLLMPKGKPKSDRQKLWNT